MNREVHTHFIVDQLGPMTYQLSLLPDITPIAWTEAGKTVIRDGRLDQLSDDEILELLKLAGELEQRTK